MKKQRSILVYGSLCFSLVSCSKGVIDSTTDSSLTETGSTATTTDTQATTDTASTGFPEPTYGMSNQTIMHDSVSREYKLYVPESYDASTPVPLMLNFHGFGGSSLEQLRSSDMRALAESENFILIYPQGTMLEGYAHWNTYLPGGDNKSDVDDFGFVEAMLDELSLNYAIDSDRVYATGYSNGGDFTYTLACLLSDRVTGIAPVSGLMWEGTLRECVTTHPTAVLSIHGTSDNTRPYDGW